MSSSLSNMFDDLQEQIYYVHCGYCDTILLVSVPCSCLTEVVKVSCGHCTSLLSVNMRSSFLPLHLFSPFQPVSLEPTTEVCFHQKNKLALDDHHAVEKGSENRNPPARVLASFSSSSDDDEEEEEGQELAEVINKPPRKKQRPPSAYNLFIGEEIQRLKAIYPTITHKQAFSMAAKNVQKWHAESCGFP
ncbi:OLC1v1028323C1 [Oldenlandia corymbosa var. corymbosa]|uniref:OLC1v1028323C1 n=1 Tax=Oldenlandia corymbosa var. corymbosa TaxID=529605 RepID=A0AAV1CBF5_OLDCO|nr:OLC1v1028323C1 [Oldenlandia corymbosa var. corymbosa]